MSWKIFILVRESQGKLYIYGLGNAVKEFSITPAFLCVWFFFTLGIPHDGQSTGHGNSQPYLEQRSL